MIKYGFNLLLWGIAVAIATLVGKMVGLSLVLFFGFNWSSAPILLGNLNSTLLFLCIMVVTAILIGELVKKLHQPFKERVVFIFIYHYFFFHVLRVVDSYFSQTRGNVPYDLLSHIIPSLLFAYLVAVIWKPEGELISFFEKFKEYIQIKNKYSWVLRFIIGCVSFVPIYLITNWLISPFVEPFYSDLDYFVRSAKNLFVLIPLKMFIGLLFVLVLLPIFILWKESKASLLFWIGFPIFIQAAVYPSVVELWLPLGMRFPYLIQYTVVTFLLAIIFVQLFFVPEEDELIDDQFNWMY